MALRAFVDELPRALERNVDFIQGDLTYAHGQIKAKNELVGALVAACVAIPVLEILTECWVYGGGAGSCWQVPPARTAFAYTLFLMPRILLQFVVLPLLLRQGYLLVVAHYRTNTAVGVTSAASLSWLIAMYALFTGGAHALNSVSGLSHLQAPEYGQLIHTALYTIVFLVGMVLWVANLVLAAPCFILGAIWSLMGVNTVVSVSFLVWVAGQFRQAQAARTQQHGGKSADVLPPGTGQFECAICYQKSDGVLSCGHVVCSVDALQLHSRVCPVCRNQFTNHIRIYS
eukprot:TRINITY_DN770_c0_g1_i1.p1 TRINITY_DN770_c0_g1~~TRINITY_DN770_c0_g1_i1.p1  ORF type:complete len:287 (+),score=42.09 TRINITY_DN770_c0_g1_i1:42-902(+)